MALTLHYHPLSSYCWKVLIALYENGAPFEACTVNLGDPAERAAYAALWPTAKIPLLVDGDRVVPYLEDDQLTPSHELEPLWVRNGSVYAFRRDIVCDRGLEAEDVRGYEMPAERSFDIDTAEDLAFAQFLVERGDRA